MITLDKVTIEPTIKHAKGGLEYSGAWGRERDLSLHRLDDCWHNYNTKSIGCCGKGLSSLRASATSVIQETYEKYNEMVAKYLQK